jgi:hypothetical protein
MTDLLVRAIAISDIFDREQVVPSPSLGFAIAIIWESGAFLVFYLFVVFLVGDGSLESIIGAGR